MSELLPCPFCGGRASLVKGRESFTHRPVHKAYCQVCQNRTVSMETQLQAKESWNRRHTPDARLKAKWQAEALEKAHARVALAVEAETVRCHLRNMARKYRRQAEGGE